MATKHQPARRQIERYKAAKDKAMAGLHAVEAKARKTVANIREEGSQNAAIAAGSAGLGAIVGAKAQEYLLDPANEMTDSMLTTGFGGIPTLTIVGAGLAIFGIAGGLKGRTQAAVTGAGAGLAAGAFVKGTGQV